MGNDGGSIPKRRELVKEAARLPTASQLKESALEQATYLWTTDPLTRLPLSAPIVSDSLGRLFNKDSVIEQLLSPSPDAVLAATVSSLKDVVELKFEQDDKGRFVCPVTRSPLGPGNKAVYSAVCGHVVSAVAERETSGSSGRCSVCDVAREEDDVIPVLATGKDEIAKLQARSKRLREEGRTHSLKKVKGEKKKKRKLDEEEEKAVKKVATQEKKDEGGINNAGTKALTEKVLAEQEKRKAERKANENIKSLFSSRDQSKPIGRSSDFMTRGYQIATDAKR